MSLRWFSLFAGASLLVSVSPAIASPRVVPVVPVVPVRPLPLPHPDWEPRDLEWKRNVLSRADGNQAGTLLRTNDKFLVLDPYEVAAGDARLRLPDDAPVFAGLRRLSVDSLHEGDDVRVYFDRRGSRRPVVVAVELLNPEEARAARRRDNPHGGEHDCDKDHWRTHSWQPGRVLSLRDGYLTFDPYQRSAGDSRLRFNDRVPVLFDGRRVDSDTLDRGTDVKVFYEGNRVVAVQILSRDEARELRRQYEWAAR